MLLTAIYPVGARHTKGAQEVCGVLSVNDTPICSLSKDAVSALALALVRFRSPLLQI